MVSISCFASRSCARLSIRFSSQCAAVFHLLDAFALQILRSFDSGFDGGAVDLRDQNPVVELVNFESNIVLRLLALSVARPSTRLAPCRSCGPDLQQCGQRLCQLRATGRQVTPTLVDCRRHRRNGASCDRTETTR